MAVPAGSKPGPQSQRHLRSVDADAEASHRPPPPARVEFAPEAPAEPDWAEWFPSLTEPNPVAGLDRGQLKDLAAEYEVAFAGNIGTEKLRERLAAVVRSEISPEAGLRVRVQNVQNERARQVAGDEWNRVVPALDEKGRLALVDRALLIDYCVVVSRIDQGERALSIEGYWVAGERGAQKNPWATGLNQYRTQLKGYIAELGLSPGSRLTDNTGSQDDELHGNWG